MEDKDAIVNEMIRDMDELKEACKMQDRKLHDLDGTVKEVVQNGEVQQATVISRLDTIIAGQKPIDLSFLSSIQKQGVEEIRQEIKRQTFQVFETKRYSIFGDRFSAESFKTVIDTTMKWIIALIITFSTVSIIKFLIHY